MDIQMYETFTKVWNSFVQNSTMLGLEDRFLCIFEQISKSYDPEKGPLVPYIRRKIHWSLQVRVRQRVRNYYRAAGYIEHLSWLAEGQGSYGNDILNKRTLNKLIAKAELSDNERKILKEFCLNPKEPTMREAGKTLGISGERVRQVSVIILNKLRKAKEKGSRNAVEERRHLCNLQESEGKYR